MADQQILAVVQALYAASAIGDWAAAEAHLSDDFFVTEADSLPYGGLYSGRNALRELFDVVIAYWADPSIDIHAITVGQDHAVGILTLNVTSRASGRRLALDIAEMFRFRGDKVVEIRPYYYDTHLVVEDGVVDDGRG